VAALLISIMAAPLPFRLEFFGDQIESLRDFDNRRSNIGA